MNTRGLNWSYPNGRNLQIQGVFRSKIKLNELTSNAMREVLVIPFTHQYTLPD